MLLNVFHEIAVDFDENSAYILRMLIATVCGAAIGIERGKRQKDAGIRTHIVVALGAALMMIVSKYGFADLLSNPGVKLDPSRIASGIVTGVGFLGAGVIFVKDVSIKGLTTAAGIWSTAGIGMAIGAGMYTVGITATVMMLLYQVFIHKFLSGLENTVNEFRVELQDVPNVIEDFKSSLDEHKITMLEYKMHRHRSTDTITLEVTIKKSRAMTMRDVLSAAGENPNVISIDF